MIIGKRNCEVTIEQNTPTRSASGEAIPAWTTYKQLWAAMQPVTGGERVAGRQVMAEADTLMEYDWIDAPAVTPRMRVVYGTRIYDILAARNLDERNHRCEAQLKELNP